MTRGGLLGSGVKNFTYMYEFGDSWEHDITIKTSDPASTDQPFVRFIAGKVTIILTFQRHSL